jgi:hypothetical protein
MNWPPCNRTSDLVLCRSRSRIDGRAGIESARRQTATQIALDAIKTLLQRGYIFLPEGEHGNVISFTPPLTITGEDLTRAVEELAAVLNPAMKLSEMRELLVRATSNSPNRSARIFCTMPINWSASSPPLKLTLQDQSAGNRARPGAADQFAHGKSRQKCWPLKKTAGWWKFARTLCCGPRFTPFGR